MGGFKNKAERTVQLFSLFAEAFNPIGSSSTLTQTLSPTATDPLVALAENKDWTGKPIAKEDFNKLSPTPGFSRNKDTASDPAKWIAEAINTISGGNKYVPGVASPTADQIDYLFGQATGGVGREASKLNQTVSAMGSGEDLPPHKIPLVGRFFGDSSGQSSQGNKFYSNLKRINEVEAELKGRTKDRLPVDEFKAENPESAVYPLPLCAVVRPESAASHAIFSRHASALRVLRVSPGRVCAGSGSLCNADPCAAVPVFSLAFSGLEPCAHFGQ
jgi:hypothetical protein